MKRLGCLLVLLVIVNQCYGACRVIPRPYNIKGCPMPKIAYTIPNFGVAVSVMAPYCERCLCEAKGATCCPLFKTPTKIPDKCKVIYKFCKPILVRKDNEAVKCPTYYG